MSICHSRFLSRSIEMFVVKDKAPIIPIMASVISEDEGRVMSTRNSDF